MIIARQIWTASRQKSKIQQQEKICSARATPVFPRSVPSLAIPARKSHQNLREVGKASTQTTVQADKVHMAIVVPLGTTLSPLLALEALATSDKTFPYSPRSCKRHVYSHRQEQTMSRTASLNASSNDSIEKLAPQEQSCSLRSWLSASKQTPRSAV